MSDFKHVSWCVVYCRTQITRLIRARTLLSARRSRDPVQSVKGHTIKMARSSLPYSYRWPFSNFIIPDHIMTIYVQDIYTSGRTEYSLKAHRNAISDSTENSLVILSFSKRIVKKARFLGELTSILNNTHSIMSIIWDTESSFGVHEASHQSSTYGNRGDRTANNHDASFSGSDPQLEHTSDCPILWASGSAQPSDIAISQTSCHFQSSEEWG